MAFRLWTATASSTRISSMRATLPPDRGEGARGCILVRLRLQRRRILRAERSRCLFGQQRHRERREEMLAAVPAVAQDGDEWQHAFAVSYRLSERIEVLGGLRYNDLD